MKGRNYSWIELNISNLYHNIALFRKKIGNQTLLLVPVKANAYGHGIAELTPWFVKAGADWLGVHSLDEALILKEKGIKNPILILGYVPFEGLDLVAENNFKIVISSLETARALEKIAAAKNKKPAVHIKIETGTNRQGVCGRELLRLAQFVHQSPHLQLEGASTHFANIEDTTDHSYAMSQIERFKSELKNLAKLGIKPPIKHTAASAAAMLFPETHYQMVRIGIAAYGLWPSRETYLSLLERGQQNQFSLKPILTWKTIVAQIKEVPAGSYIGYGCTYRTTRNIRLAILPIGYYDGFDRGFSNIGYVLIRGKRAPIRGRVCMNLTMVDVTDIPDVRQEDEVVLLGKQGDEELSAEHLASLIGTINYEIVARIGSHLPRYPVNLPSDRTAER